MNAQPREQHTGGITRWRFVLVMGVFACLLLVVSVRLVMLHTIEQPFLFEQGEKRMLRTEVQLAGRGKILDRHGRPLAVSTPVVTLWLNPQQVNLQQIPMLAKVLKLKPAALSRKVERAASQGRSFLYIKRQVAPELARQALDLDIAGVYGEDDFRRYYPAAEVAAHALGIVSIDGRGQEGLELAFDEHLSGHNGSRRVVKDLYGNVIKQLGIEQESRPGKDLKLTMDLRLQYIAYRELKAAVRQHKAKSGSVVLLDARSGEVLAMANQPSYNPNNRALLQAGRMRNRALADVIEPGSTMKPFTVAAALDSGRYAPSTRIDTSPGYMRVKHKTVRDHRNYGVLDITGVITKSSNVGVSKLAHNLGADTLWRFFHDAGMGEATALGFPGEAVGRLPYPEQMDALRLATMSYGYGLSVSPLQLAQAYTSFSQQGCRLPVRLLLDKNASNQQSCHRVMKAKTAKQVLAMLETVTSSAGTGRRVKVSGYRVGGKTGTVHKLGRHGYQDDAYTSVFAGIAPISDPELVLVIVVDDPQGKEYYGGEVAAPVFSRIMQQALRLRQAAPDGKHIQQFNAKAHVAHGKGGAA